MKLNKALTGALVGISIANAVYSQNTTEISVIENTSDNITKALKNETSLAENSPRPDPNTVLNDMSKLSEYISRAEDMMNGTSVDKKSFMVMKGYQIIEHISKFGLSSSLGKTPQELKNDREFLQKAISIEEKIEQIDSSYVVNHKGQEKLQKEINKQRLSMPSEPMGDSVSVEQKKAYEAQDRQRQAEMDALKAKAGPLIRQADSIAAEIAHAYSISLQLLQDEQRKIFEQKTYVNNDNRKDAHRLHDKVIAVFRMTFKNELDIRERF